MPPERQANTMRLAFSGKMRSGKGEAMEYLNDKYFGNSAIQMNFADPLYELSGIIQNYCGVPVEKDRMLLQFLGTEYGRTHNPNMWINRLFGDMECKHKYNTVMIGDARFTNELDACKSRNIPIIYLVAEDAVRLSRGATWDKMHHASENDMDFYSNYDFIIENNGTKEEFQEKLDIMFGDILMKMTSSQPIVSSKLGSPLDIKLVEAPGMSGVRITASGLYLP